MDIQALETDQNINDQVAEKMRLMKLYEAINKNMSDLNTIATTGAEHLYFAKDKEVAAKIYGEKTIIIKDIMDASAKTLNVLAQMIV